MFNKVNYIKKLEELEEKVKNIESKQQGIDEDIDLSNVILNKLIESNYTIYKLDNKKLNNVINSGFAFTWAFTLNDTNYKNKLSTNINFKTIFLDDIQSIGKYETFNIGDDTYFIVKKETITKITKSKKTKK